MDVVKVDLKKMAFETSFRINVHVETRTGQQWLEERVMGKEQFILSI